MTGSIPQDLAENAMLQSGNVKQIAKSKLRAARSDYNSNTPMYAAYTAAIAFIDNMKEDDE